MPKKYSLYLAHFILAIIISFKFIENRLASFKLRKLPDSNAVCCS